MMKMYKAKQKRVAWLTRIGIHPVVIRYQEGHGWYVDMIGDMPQSRFTYHKTAEEAVEVLERTLL
ncbi:hypothetical protein [Limosilactobacillus equigenerosi]|uniref:hypothetical protein n=2 Tax=Limosilactobacillus equigenerosi TaxID=417373 RepID=UPI0006CFC9F2|nr:hypothetical protein [Limosilactobacillus equigenerosi]